MISLLLYTSPRLQKPRMSVNNKDIIQIFLAYNLLISYRTAPISDSFVE